MIERRDATTQQASLFEARRDGREGMVTVVDYDGRIVGSMGVETWRRVLEELADRPVEPGDTTFQWLIERGQPERQEPTVWLEHSVRHPARDKRWTTDANEAAMFPTKKAAEDYIYERLTHPIRGASARAVEHGFMVGDE